MQCVEEELATYMNPGTQGNTFLTPMQQLAAEGKAALATTTLPAHASAQKQDKGGRTWRPETQHSLNITARSW